MSFRNRMWSLEIASLYWITIMRTSREMLKPSNLATENVSVSKCLFYFVDTKCFTARAVVVATYAHRLSSFISIVSLGSFPSSPLGHFHRLPWVISIVSLGSFHRLPWVIPSSPLRHSDRLSWVIPIVSLNLFRSSSWSGPRPRPMRISNEIWRTRTMCNMSI